MSLEPLTFQPFPLSHIAPAGWLRQQLRTQADGLSGHLDTFWPDIKDSVWIGGRADGWERMPYWLDGVIPLAWLLGDAPLKQRITGYMDYILEHQGEDGWMGPTIKQNPAAEDVWSQALVLKMLVVYHGATGDDRVPVVVERALRKIGRHVDMSPLSRWGQFRWFEFLVAIWWLYERTGAPWLLDLAVTLHAQGFDWPAFFRRWPLAAPTPKGRWNHPGHVVNNAMAVKSGPLWWRLSGEEPDRNAAAAMVEALDRHHGMPTGVFTGDECLAGLGATQGTELCAVAEYMYSLEWLVAVLGDPAFADRIERIAFNALPATFSPDMWSHQYDQQLNQVECSVRENRTWNTNGPDANTFGLEPNFGCCTANLSQAWPKFAAHLWMRAPNDGIAAVAYAPSRLQTEVRGVPVSVDLQTEYPFRTKLAFTVRASRPVAFPLLLRIPAWAAGAHVAVGGERTAVAGGAFHTVARTWEGETRLELDLPMAPRLLRRPNDAVSIARGPLLYALAVGEDWRRINADRPLRELPHGDWEVYPTTPWNYALAVDERTLARDIRFEEHGLGNPLFSPEHPPVSATVTGCRVPEWTMVNGSAGPTPCGPIRTETPAEELRLIPCGCTNLRIAEFPVCAPRTVGATTGA